MMHTMTKNVNVYSHLPFDRISGSFNTSLTNKTRSAGTFNAQSPDPVNMTFKLIKDINRFMETITETVHIVNPCAEVDTVCSMLKSFLFPDFGASIDGFKNRQVANLARDTTTCQATTSSGMNKRSDSEQGKRNAWEQLRSY